MIDLAIVIGSTRPGRKGEAVADWVHDLAEWTNKAVGFVGYGSAGGARAIEHLRLVLSCLQVAHVSAQVELSLFTDFDDFTVFRPAGRHEDALTTLLDQVIAWGTALKVLRRGEHHGT
ncbi:NAD(P)H-dependent FMN reductase [Streptomyces phaeochromogenes]|uniref:NADPH-dependent FMN reductase n=1 Tax=Streptomyces phaeochromogenes TaxID=1923 RepID=UPI0027909EB5|nr:NAD(P)H-dependent oxidoreductase [Streptomyces phaeochromogenes]MDQ0947026.1 NAD(P)H-dependent FMN reductase [Streptomyces phaeochromogenes]